jgi:hemerythrin-like domain-containing protein
MLDKPTPNIALDLQRIHRVITRGLAVLEENCALFAESGFPDETTREGFWKYCQALEANIQGHHMAEDDIFFPVVESRLPERDIQRLRVEHQVLATILGQVKVAREAGSPAELRPALSRLAGVWYPHIGKEETWFSPEIMAQVMTVPEHIDMAQKTAAHSAAHAQPAPLCVPFLLYNAEAEDRAHYVSVMPPELTQQLVPIVWKEEWAAMKPFLLP